MYLVEIVHERIKLLLLCVLLEELGVSNDRVERGAQLVAHHGQKFIFELVGFLRREGLDLERFVLFETFCERFCEVLSGRFVQPTQKCSEHKRIHRRDDVALDRRACCPLWHVDAKTRERSECRNLDKD